jgi:hypothetical protein
MTVDNEPSAYLLRKVASAWGVAFELEKLFRTGGDEPATYHVNVDPGNPEKGHHSCECRGALYHTPRTGRPCRHVACLLSLIAEGRIDGAPVRAACEVCDQAPATVGAECQRCNDAAALARAQRCDLDDL